MRPERRARSPATSAKGGTSCETADVAATIGRYYHGVILISDARLKSSPVTGIYDLNDPVRALRALAASYGGVARRITPYLVVVSTG